MSEPGIDTGTLEGLEKAALAAFWFRDRFSKEVAAESEKALDAAIRAHYAATRSGSGHLTDLLDKSARRGHTAGVAACIAELRQAAEDAEKNEDSASCEAYKQAANLLEVMSA